jgi:phenylpropionate dioxygenase-like ring-hydroxylating dioxygenase large terminal subunit
MSQDLPPLDETLQPGPGTGAAWAQAAASPEVFAREQERLGHAWTLVTTTWDLPHENSWIRTRLGGRSVFIQRFGDRIRGFENQCAHRSFPIRTTDRGAGPVVCGFHHWRYDEDGLARGIPVCLDVFGKAPRALGARLCALEVETCGALVFARFPGARATQSLEAYLGPAYPILAAFCPGQAQPRRVAGEIAANWKFAMQISMDDYHLVAVHPTTFGKNGYLKMEHVNYHRFGDHSAFFTDGFAGGLDKMAADCRENAYYPHGYRILHLFPGLAVNHFHAFRLGPIGFWYVLVLSYTPLAHDRSAVRAWYFPSPFEPRTGVLRDAVRALTRPFLNRIIARYVRRVLAEDHAVCEAMQPHAAQVDRPPLLGRQETRVGWFEEAYARHLRD